MVINAESLRGKLKVVLQMRKTLSIFFLMAADVEIVNCISSHFYESILIWLKMESPI